MQRPWGQGRDLGLFREEPEGRCDWDVSPGEVGTGEFRGQGSKPPGGWEARPDHEGSLRLWEEDGFHWCTHGSPCVHCVGRELRHTPSLDGVGHPLPAVSALQCAWGALQPGVGGEGEKPYGEPGTTPAQSLGLG